MPAHELLATSESELFHNLHSPTPEVSGCGMIFPLNYCTLEGCIEASSENPRLGLTSEQLYTYVTYVGLEGHCFSEHDGAKKTGVRRAQSAAATACNRRHEPAPLQVHNRMLQLGDAARGRLGYGQHRRARCESATDVFGVLIPECR